MPEIDFELAPALRGGNIASAPDGTSGSYGGAHWLATHV